MVLFLKKLLCFALGALNDCAAAIVAINMRSFISDPRNVCGALSALSRVFRRLNTMAHAKIEITSSQRVGRLEPGIKSRSRAS